MMTTSNENIQMENLLAFYPSIDTEEFQRKITAKKEFNETASSPAETLKKMRGDYYKHQIFIRRFMSHYDRLLMLHETGTGKSCAITAAGEYWREQAYANKDFYEKKSKEEQEDEKLHIKRVIILVNNKQLVNEMMDAIVCHCTDGIYDLPKFQGSRIKIRNFLKKWYIIEKRNTFINNIANKSNSEIIEEYSNTLFVVDEAHNLRFKSSNVDISDTEESLESVFKETLDLFKQKDLKEIVMEEFGLTIPKNKKKKVDVISYIYSELNEDSSSFSVIQNIINSKRYKTSKKKNKATFSNEDKYVQFWRLFHIPRQCKYILASASIMVDLDDEIVDILNLILPAKIPYELFPSFESSLGEYKGLNIKQLGEITAINPNIKIQKDSDEETLLSYFKGRVSYVRRLDTGINIINEGIPISEISGYAHEESDYDFLIKAYLSQMTGIQKKTFSKVIKTKKNALQLKERQISNFVYPDGSIGSNSFDKYIKKIGKRYHIRGDKNGKKLRGMLANIDGIRELACKFASAIEIIKKTNGVGFVYSNLVKASGIIQFSLCLEAQGFKYFNEVYSNVFETVVVGNDNNFCAFERSKNKKIVSSFKPEPRFFLLTSETTQEEFSLALELMNAPENLHGDYLQLFLTSPVGSQGFSIPNVVTIHLLDQDWKRTTSYQAESRAIRSTSHINLLKELKRDSGLEDARVDVRIYNHTAYFESDGAVKSVDIRMLERSEEKDRRINKIIRLMQRSAVDCQIQHYRNTRINPSIFHDKDFKGVSEKDYTAECNYDVCAYTCIDPEPKEQDYSTYQVYYLWEVIDHITLLLKNIFKEKFVITFEQLLRVVIDRKINIPHQMRYIEYAVYELTNNKYLFHNRYGMPSFLQKDGNILFLKESFPNIIDEYQGKLLLYYSDHLIAKQDIMLENMDLKEEEEEKLEQMDNIEEILENNGPFSSEFEDIFYKTKISILQKLLEESIEAYSKGEMTYLQEKIIDRFSGVSVEQSKKLSKKEKRSILPYPKLWFSMRIPNIFISREEEKFRKKQTGKGRKKIKGPRVPKKLFYDPETFAETIWKSTEKENVYFHMLKSLEKSKLEFEQIPKYNNVTGIIRLYIPSEGVWRDATPIEQVVYSLRAQKEIYDFKEYFESYPVYGIKSLDTPIRIRTKFKEKTDPSKINKNKRNIFRGTICKNLATKDIIEIIINLKIPINKYLEKETINEIKKISRKDLIILLNTKKVFRGTNFNKKILEMETEILQTYWMWVVTKFSRSTFCSIIHDYLTEQNLIYRFH